jgi:AcrR family transcriptional regulator
VTLQRPTRAESQDSTRRDLLRAAGRLFLRHGYVATSLSDIAAEAGVTKGAVYSNFASKEDLFLTLLDEPIVSTETFAPSRVVSFDGDAAATGQDFGRYASAMRPALAHIALFLEANAVALRSPRARAQVGASTRSFARDLGVKLVDALGLTEADPLAVGLLCQSLFAGLMMHGAFIDEIDDELFAGAFTSLFVGAQLAGANRAG